MSTDTFVLYSTARISRDEYNDWLHQLNAVMKPGSSGAYDARLSKDILHVWISLLEEKWFDMYMAEFNDQPELLAKVCQLIGGKPRSIIVLDVNKVEGSQILAVQFTALCAEHYPCIVLQDAGQALIPRQEILELRDAGMGFDGYTWETADPERGSMVSRILDEAEELAEEQKPIWQNKAAPDNRTIPARMAMPRLEGPGGPVVPSHDQLSEQTRHLGT